MHPVERTASEWFEEAQRCYLVQHQGCAWCGGSHRVHQVQLRIGFGFMCQRCDFQVIFDPKTQTYQFIPGEEVNIASDTMLGYPIFQS